MPPDIAVGSIKRVRQVSADNIVVQQAPKRAKRDEQPDERLSPGDLGLPRHPAYHPSAARLEKTLIDYIDRTLSLVGELEGPGHTNREL
ncbi:hypothetical protein CLAFUW4_14665 [Fulvia fulva]|uniref:Uncharacterized protein n=1 Tax=Passalora fulva TaxID=5499 RepID=A0A9Q8UWC6_PASFU|nr:uncharacterized protein CLAFUR5_14493 [Fulvia fulva]KAK4609323.1 hypothetical protein CLAFUR4_14659 [Fulvia fulva]KAK4609618.1 hypothetical protein CLAFUR0_14658 [Fulvia fulva]UJO24850.1 hypothetical protein CLAFUR5_14493 [Fulvia fulva]WPV22642.1 hypothetical protein CLAFUW4_14665 [Fulvia fulva]WPV37733.1 hypothetical protein CLAFUW7_14668 [Fulvia fulva]